MEKFNYKNEFNLNDNNNKDKIVKKMLNIWEKHIYKTKKNNSNYPNRILNINNYYNEYKDYNSLRKTYNMKWIQYLIN